MKIDHSELKYRIERTDKTGVRTFGEKKESRNFDEIEIDRL